MEEQDASTNSLTLPLLRTRILSHLYQVRYKFTLFIYVIEQYQNLHPHILILPKAFCDCGWSHEGNVRESEVHQGFPFLDARSESQQALEGLPYSK